MASLGIMIEGQEDLTWQRLFRLAQVVEDLGFESLFRSDHLTALEAPAGRETLALWPSLTALALRTRRIRFGPLVCSMTFRHPAEVAMMAASVDGLSGGRFELGIGAGWFRGEHRMFGIAFPPFQTRLEMLDEAAQAIKALWSGQLSSFHGQHYQLLGARALPKPAQEHPPLILGGKNEQQTLPLVARHASEWNCTYMGVAGFSHKSRVLDEHCRAAGRDPASLRRSLMTPFVIGPNAAKVLNRIEAHRRTFPSLPATLEDWLAAGYVGGTPAQVVEQLQAFEAAGVDRFLLQHNDLDDVGSLELLAAQVLPQIDNGGGPATAAIVDSSTQGE